MNKLVIEDDGRSFQFSGPLFLAELDAIGQGLRMTKECVRSIASDPVFESGWKSPSREGCMDKSSSDIRILIADDHRLFREGLRKLLESEPGFKVVDFAVDGEEAISATRKLKPDILLLDLAMPRCSGLEALRELAANSNSVRTIILAASIETAQIAEAIKLGARGIVLKDTASELLFESIRTVMAGQYWVGRESVSNLVQVVRDLLPRCQAPVGHKPFKLTTREVEIIEAVAAGYTNRDIAQKFSIKDQTVKHHLSNIFDKLGVSNRLELLLFAIHHQLV